MSQTPRSRDALLLALTDLLREAEPDETLLSVCGIIGNFFACSRVGMAHLKDGFFDYRVCWTDGAVPQLLGRFPAHAFGVQIVAKLTRGESVVVSDLYGDPLSDETLTHETAAEVDTRAILVVPFLWAGHLRSIVYLNSQTPRNWTDEEVALLEDIAERTRRIIELAEVARQQRESVERLRFLDELGREIAKFSQAREILGVTTRMVGEHLGVSVCAYADVEDDEDTFTIRGDWAAPGSATIVGRYSLATFGRLAVQSLRAGMPLVINNNLEELAPTEAQAFQDLGITATICMPLVKEGHLRALMAVHHKGPHTWTERELTLIREVTERSWAHVERTRTEAELRESEARLEMATAAAELGIWDWDLVTGKLQYSPRAKAISGFAPDSYITYEMVRAIVHPEDFPVTSRETQQALDPAVRKNGTYEYRLIRPDGSVRWVLAHGAAVFAGEAGECRAIRYVGTIQDVTESRRLRDSERAASQRLQLAVEAGRMAVWETDLLNDTMASSPELNRILGFASDAVPSKEEIAARYYPGEHERVRELGRIAVTRKDRFLEAEFRYIWASGEIRWLLLRCEILFENSRPVKAVGVVTDVTERREIEEQRELLVAELSHRVKNTLATVVSIEQQSFDKSPSIEHGRRSFRSRILALAQTHTRLAEGNWAGVCLSTLLSDELRPYRQDDGANIQIAGPAITLNSKAALTLGMAFHELTTNAAKYGALSSKEGRLQVSWTLTATALNFEWTEKMGPTVSMPTRRGFGVFLVERGVASDLKGVVRLSFEPEGVKCSMALPIERVRVGEIVNAA